jgi:glutathione S-transferase
MQLIGMLDSPYVRRVAISLRLLGIAFEHRPVSVFRHFDTFAAINPLVKAPTLVANDGTVLMDSTLILDHLPALTSTPLPRPLMPTDPAACRQALRVLGLALAACEKSVQIVYEQQLRPTNKQHSPWLDRVQGQLAAAYQALEAELARTPLAADAAHINQAGITAAVAWGFTQMALPGTVPTAMHPHLSAHATAAEQLAAFAEYPANG